MKFVVFLMIFLGLTGPVLSQTVTVKSGEHEGFSRIVLNFPEPVDWSLKREAGGYVLAVKDIFFDYDLSDVYRRLTTKRLARITPDASTGDLRMELDCNCHAFPFELQPGVLVIDLKDGIAPKGSSFELADDGTRQPPLSSSEPKISETKPQPKVTKTNSAPPRPTRLSDAIEGAARTPQFQQPLPILDSAAALEETKDELLWQLGIGASEGVVEIVKDLKDNYVGKDSGMVNENVRIGAEAGVNARAERDETNHMTGVGFACIPDSRLNIKDWGDNGQPASEFTLKTTGLVGEFDRPDDMAISRSVRYYLALGFGTEARQLLDALVVPLPDRKIWEAMSHIVDLETPPDTVFSGMEVCETSASLWAVLAQPEMPPPNQVAIPAILRSFSSLPLHLRRHLGPGLASRFLARNDPGTARTISDAIQRAAGETSSNLQFLEAEIDLANGKTDSAEAILITLSGNTGPVSIHSTIALIRAQTDAGREVQAELTTTTEALLQEARGGEYDNILRNALALAYASQNRYETAFDILNRPESEIIPIWNMLANQGSDSAIVTHAILPTAASTPILPAIMERTLARRLLDLGFPDPALLWLQGAHRTSGNLPAPDQLLIAEAELARNNTITALERLENMEGETANALRAQALALLQTPEAIDQLAGSEHMAEAARAARQQGAWSELSRLEAKGTWHEAAQLVVSLSLPHSAVFSATLEGDAVPVEVGALAKTRETLEESAAARSLLEKLISEHPLP